MTRYLILFFAVLFLSVPVLAQEEAVQKPINVMSDGDPAIRLELSKKMHEIWPVRQKIEGALDAVSKTVKESERLKFKGALRRSIDFDALEKVSIDAMADVFTQDELAKMVAFYGSKEGRSVVHKRQDYEKLLEPLMVKMLDRALLDAKVGTPKVGAQSVPK